MPLFILFVDLCKAYDCVDHTKLYLALMEELGVSAGVVTVLQHMYADVKARVLCKLVLSAAFPIQWVVL